MKHLVGRARGFLDRLLDGGHGRTDAGSLAYRKNREAILRGEVPVKYSRIVEIVPGDRVLELGAAEGVLSLLLAARKAAVIALELRQARHEEALRLQAVWRRRGLDVDRCEMVLGNITDRLDLLTRVDTLLAVRSIYYLRDRLDPVFAHVSRHVPHVVLCGNWNRARRYHETDGRPDDRLGAFNFFASLEGMTALLTRHGYAIEQTVEDGDPIVVGRRGRPPAGSGGPSRGGGNDPA